MSNITIKMKFDWGDSVLKQTKVKLKQDIMNSVERNPEAYKEVKGVFQKANRRIERLLKAQEKSGLISPALTSIMEQVEAKGKNSYAVFNFGGGNKDWYSVTEDYATAVAFLNRKTSVVAGARKYEKQLRKQLSDKYPIMKNDDYWNAHKAEISETYSGHEGVVKSLAPYSKVVQSMYNTKVLSDSRAIESESKDLTKRIKNNVTNFVNEATDYVSEELKNLPLNGYKRKRRRKK